MKRFLIFLIFIGFISCKKAKEIKGNNPPQILFAKIEPENLKKNQRAGALISANDKDGDDITYKIEWFLNGKKIYEGKEIETHNFKKGDTLYAVITPYDGKEYGKSYKTAPALIKNTPPEIISAKFLPETILTITHKIEVKAEGKDIDDDKISFLVEWYINGEKKGEGLSFSPQKLKENELLEAVVYAYDGEEKSKNFVTISANVSNSPPIIDLKQNEIKLSSYPYFTYKINAYDPDGDDLKFEIVSSNVKGIEIDENGIIKGKIEENIKNINLRIKIIDKKGNYIEKNLTFSF
jgi:hypothetical protein